MRWLAACGLLERALIERLRATATTPAARGLMDDAAVWTPPIGRDLVFTHDMLAAGVHFVGDEPPGDVAHKLVAVNLSDLAAMGARPVGVLLGLGLATVDAGWADAFVDGLAAALARWKVALWGGDTVAGLERLTLGLTAIGQIAPGAALARGGLRPGDEVWVSGNIGDAGLGLRVARGELPPNPELLGRYRRPEPRLALGEALVGLASAAADVSDGLLLDAERMAGASGVGVTIELTRLPISRAAEALGAHSVALATAGDDYELVFGVAPTRAAVLPALSRRLRLRLTRVGTVAAGAGLTVLGIDGTSIDVDRLGWEHRG